MPIRTSRRDVLKISTAAAAGAVMPYWFSSQRSLAQENRSPNERPLLGCIGTGDRWKQIIGGAANYATGVAVCDVDANHMREGLEVVKQRNGEKHNKPVDSYEDYRKLLDRKDIDVVTIVTPDHWHSKIAIEAMQAGKDVYCEKPLTLTIKEGKQICNVLDQTKRVFQVGTQQRSEMGSRFLTAVAMVKGGRIGKVQRVTCNIGGVGASGEIPVADVPTELNFDMWLGQAPMVKYRSKPMANEKARYPYSRVHYEFRWWYEYSGGKMTDWGAHHVDIANWALGIDQTGPVSLEPVPGTVEHLCPLKNGVPTRDDMYNVAGKFDVKVMCPGNVEMHIVSDSPDGNGILFEGTEGRFHVSRGAMKGAPVDDLKANPLPEDALVKLYKGKQPGNHMGNFFECIKTREQPISDVYSHHRSMTTCHLANIAIRLDRKINWDATKQEIIGDDEANLWQSREQRKGYEITIPV